MVLPLFFVVFQNVHQHHDRGGGGIFGAQITQSGLATPVLMLLFLSAFMLPLIAALVAGDIVAAEDGNGTLKTILTRSVEPRPDLRGEGAGGDDLRHDSRVLLAALVATVAGVASWGFTLVTTYSDTVVSASKACCWCSPPTPST